MKSKQPLNIQFFFPRKSCLLGGDTKKCGRNGHATYDTIVRRIVFACWVIQTTDTQSEYAIRVAF